MPERVVIVGMGNSVAGQRFNRSHEDLLVEAGLAAFADAGLDAGDVHGSWFGCTTVSANHALLNFSLKLSYVGMTKVSAAGATGAEAMRLAYLAVASGTHDIVLAAGVEKPSDAGLTDFNEGHALSATAATGDAPELRPAVQSATYLTRYAHHYGISEEEIRAALTHVVTRNRRNGSHNEKAALQDSLSDEEVEGAPLSAVPMTTADCAVATDGATVAILCAESVAAERRLGGVLIEGFGAASGGMEGRLRSDYGFTEIPEVRIAAERAYAMAGITDPLVEIDHAQLFDLTSAAELLAYEDLGLAGRGEAVQSILAGTFDLEGRVPTNTDGGLLANGFQAGASGLRQVYESYLQVGQRAGDRQLPGISRSLVHTVGGGVGSFSALVQILGRRD